MNQSRSLVVYFILRTDNFVESKYGIRTNVLAHVQCRTYQILFVYKRIVKIFSENKVRNEESVTQTIRMESHTIHKG